MTTPATLLLGLGLTAGLSTLALGGDGPADSGCSDRAASAVAACSTEPACSTLFERDRTASFGVPDGKSES